MRMVNWFLLPQIYLKVIYHQLKSFWKSKVYKLKKVGETPLFSFDTLDIDAQLWYCISKLDEMIRGDTDVK